VSGKVLKAKEKAREYLGEAQDKTNALHSL